MIMLHVVFSSFYCWLWVTVWSLLFSGPLMRSIRIGSLNINGGKIGQKRALISAAATLNGADVLFLQETHTQPADEIDWRLWWGGSCVFSHRTNVSAGVAVLFAPSSGAVLLSTVEVVKGRLLVVRANIDGTVFCFANVYSPTVGAGRVDLFARLGDVLAA